MNKSKILAVLLLTLSLLLGISGALAEEAEFIDQERLADAIFKAENSVKYPYGIKSVDTHGNEAYARKICLNTINRNLARWQWARQHGDERDYITFLGDRYCPKASDTLGHKVWSENVKLIYNTFTHT